MVLLSSLGIAVCAREFPLEVRCSRGPARGSHLLAVVVLHEKHGPNGVGMGQTAWHVPDACLKGKGKPAGGVFAVVVMRHPGHAPDYRTRERGPAGTNLALPHPCYRHFTWKRSPARGRHLLAVVVLHLRHGPDHTGRGVTLDRGCEVVGGGVEMGPWENGAMSLLDVAVKYFSRGGHDGGVG